MSDAATTERPPADGVGDPTSPVGSPTDSPAAEPSSGSTTFETLAVVGFVFGIFAIVVAVFALGLSARAVKEAGSGGGSGGGGNAPAAIEVSGTEFKFDPSEAAITSGGTITFHNEGTIDHDLVVNGLATEMISAGESGEVVLEGLDPGDYQYYCSVPGHRDAGMEGSLTVQ